MVTPVASERAAGIDPALVAVAGRLPGRPCTAKASTVATVAEEPPPKTSARRPSSPTAASCRGALSTPIRRCVPVLVLRE